jgi:hypothetical protein
MVNGKSYPYTAAGKAAAKKAAKKPTPSPKPMTYWEKEEATRPKMDWRNAPDSGSAKEIAKRKAAEKKAMAKRDALKKRMGK